MASATSAQARCTSPIVPTISAASTAKPSSQRTRRAPPGSMRPNSAGLAMLAKVIASATLPLWISEKPWRSTRSGPSHSPRSVMKPAYATAA